MKFIVTIQVEVEVDALNPYQAAARAAVEYEGEVVDVAQKKKQPPRSTWNTNGRKPLSPAARARLAENLVKARAAKARKAKRTKTQKAAQR